MAWFNNKCYSKNEIQHDGHLVYRKSSPHLFLDEFATIIRFELMQCAIQVLYLYSKKL